MKTAEEFYNEWFFADDDIPLSEAEKEVIECMGWYAEECAVGFAKWYNENGFLMGQPREELYREWIKKQL